MKTLFHFLILLSVLFSKGTWSYRSFIFTKRILKLSVKVSKNDQNGLFPPPPPPSFPSDLNYNQTNDNNFGSGNEQIEEIERYFKEKSRNSFIKNTLTNILVASIIRFFFISSYHIPSTSMVPTFLIGDCFFAEKISRRFSLKSNNIIVFHPKNSKDNLINNEIWIKRIAAIEGDVIQIKNGTILVNGIPFQSQRSNSIDPLDMRPIRIPKSHVFVVGDNLDDSYDSRYWGVLPKENVVGKAIFRFWPLDRLSFFVSNYLFS